MKAKVNIGFSRTPDSELDERAKGIIEKLTGNGDFPTPSPTLATVQTALDDYSKALGMQRGQARTDTTRVRRATLEDLLQKLGTYVNTTADGDESKLINSGF